MVDISFSGSLKKKKGGNQRGNRPGAAKRQKNQEKKEKGKKRPKDQKEGMEREPKRR